MKYSIGEFELGIFFLYFFPPIPNPKNTNPNSKSTFGHLGAAILKEGLPPPTCHVSHIMCPISCVMCNMSCVMCHVSCVMCHMSHVTCPNFYLFFLFWTKLEEGLLSTGQPRLVFMGAKNGSCLVGDRREGSCVPGHVVAEVGEEGQQED